MTRAETPAEIRQQRGLSVSQVAEAMGTVKSAVSAIETGRSQVSEASIARWAAAVGVSYERAYRARWGAVRQHARNLLREAEERLSSPVRRRVGIDSTQNRD